MFFADDFKLILFIEEAILFLFESPRCPDESDSDELNFDELDAEEQDEDLCALSVDEVAKRLQASWGNEADQPDSVEEWRAVAAAVSAILQLQDHYWRRHSKNEKVNS